MKRTLLVITMAVMIALPLVLGSVFVFAEAPGALKLDIAAEAFKGGKKKKSAVDFDHAEHVTGYAIGCEACHHKADLASIQGGATPQKCVSDGCHGPAEKVVEGKKMVDSEDAYHDNCKGCHKKEKKGPTKCKDCHP